MEKDFQAMEQAYRDQAAAPGAELMVFVDAVIRMRQNPDNYAGELTVVVDRFIRAWPLERCERAMVDASLTNTYWRLVRLEGNEVKPSERHREPHVLLRSYEHRYVATVGCNQIVGSFSTKGIAIEFGKPAVTLMVCPPPLVQLELRLVDILGRAITWRIDGMVLELTDIKGRELALLQAIYLR
jgi:copper homeostasis protein (lipoprotein)